MKKGGGKLRKSNQGVGLGGGGGSTAARELWLGTKHYYPCTFFLLLHATTTANFHQYEIKFLKPINNHCAAFLNQYWFPASNPGRLRRAMRKIILELMAEQSGLCKINKDVDANSAQRFDWIVERAGELANGQVLLDNLMEALNEPAMSESEKVCIVLFEFC